MILAALPAFAVTVTDGRVRAPVVRIVAAADLPGLVVAGI